MSMTHRTSSSRLKARMGTYMRAVRAGEEVVVTDRDQPVARLVPYRKTEPAQGEHLEVAQAKDPGAPPLSKVVVRPIRYRGPSTTSLLEDDRRRR
jgi:prevent-host-death family protein